MSLQITTNPVDLRKPCLPCETIEEGLEICDQLSQALTDSLVLGIGLAANQIGIQKRVCLLRVPETDSQGFRYTVELKLINPKVSGLQRPVIFNQEGCLSFPGKTVRTLRYTRCVVIDDLEPEGRELIGMRAICAQHETSHLDSQTMFDVIFDDIKPNASCPCGSGERFKKCCRLAAKEI